MPVLTRGPSLARPLPALPDPTQRVSFLRTAERQRWLALFAFAAPGVAAGVGLMAALDRYDLDPGSPLVAVILQLIFCGFAWRELLPRFHDAEPVVHPVRVVSFAVSGRRGLVITVVFATIAVLDGLIGDSGYAIGYAAGMLPRVAVMDALIAWRERRDGRRYLERADLDDDELLHAAPGELDPA